MIRTQMLNLKLCKLHAANSAHSKHIHNQTQDAMGHGLGHKMSIALQTPFLVLHPSNRHHHIRGIARRQQDDHVGDGT